MNTPGLYSEIAQQAKALTADEPSLIANLANVSALLFERLEDVNWVGFYFNETGRDKTLVLGPFQGKVACVRIPFGQGVCGTAAAQQETQVVTDVHEFPGHIACDAASNSEVVIPILADGKTVAVLDIDSPSIGRFNSEDKNGLEQLLPILTAFDWTNYGA